ncbi:ABC transporter substrate binding protein [Desulfococcaceae bacterium HSG7]|nr:ABC transporter substrate binding protein [Desulfococcaceae bacterium HSG7]
MKRIIDKAGKNSKHPDKKTGIMAKKISHILMIGVFALCSLCSSIESAEQREGTDAPATNKGEKWRIGYIEGGPWQDYQSNLAALIISLAKMGWIENKSLPAYKDKHETRTIWYWLAADVKSDYLEFVADAYWSAGWDENTRKEIKKDVITRLNKKKDIDLMLAFGTTAAQDMVNNLHSVPTMVLSSSDPIRAGIVKSAEDSGYDHIHARVDPTRYERQIRLFHKIARFKTLGIAFEDTLAGRTYAAIEDAKKVAGELGFEVIKCHAPDDDIPDIQERDRRLLECYQKLAPRVDAFYLTAHKSLTLKNLPMLLAPFLDHKVATFSQGRTGEVKYGVLISLARPNYRPVGRFYAKTFTRILQGAKPRDLPQIFQERQEIAINLETARKIGFPFPMDILAGAKEIYERIEPAE